MLSRKSNKPNRRPELVERSPRGNISRVIIRSKQEGQPGSIRINVPGEHRQSEEQEGFLLGLPATHQNLAAVQGVLDKLNARIHILKDLDIKSLTKRELKDYILEQLGQPKQEKAKPVLGKSLESLFLEFMEHRRSILKRSKGTLATYNTVYKIIKKLKTKDLACRDEILKELGELPYPAYYRALQKISACCNWAVEEDKIQKNPFLVILKSLREPSKTDEHPDPFSRQAMERIIEAYRKHPKYSYYTDLVEFYFLTGVRTGEAVALLWSDVDFERGLIYIRKTTACVGGKNDRRDETKTKKDRVFPIEDPALIKLLKRLWSPDKKTADFVFQEADGGEINRENFYTSWRGRWNTRELKCGRKKEYPPTGVVYQLAVLGEEEGGIDHYRPQYNTRHTFISLAIEGLVELNESTMQEVVSLADYVGNSADVILRHYLGRSKRRKIVIVSESSEKTEVPNSEEGKPQAQTAQIKQVVELEHQNVRLQTILQSLVRLIQTILVQFVPEAQRTQLLAFVTTIVGHNLPSSNSNTLEPVKSESVKSLDEELAECAAWLSFQEDTD